MKRSFYIMALCLFLVGVHSTSSAVERLVIAGTGDSQVAVRELAKLFEKTYPGNKITVPDSVGSSGGIKALQEGKVGLARTARMLKGKELGKGCVETAFAFSPVVFATNANQNAVQNITMSDVIRLYDGTMKNWSELGGEDHKIYAVNRESGDSSREVIDSYLSTISSESEKLEDGGKIIYSTQAAAEAIEQHNDTIGFVTLPIANAMGINVLSLDSIYPSEANVQNKNYPLVTTYYLVTPANPSKLATAFVDFAREEAAQKLLRSLYIVPAGKSLQ